MKTAAELLTDLVATRVADDKARRDAQTERLRLALLGWGQE